MLLLHLVHELVVCQGGGHVGSCGGIERFNPSWRGWKWSRLILGNWHTPEPGVDVFLTEFVDVHVTIDFNIVFRLDDVNAIEHIK